VTVVRDLPIGGDHDYKSIVVARDGSLYVNVGSASNSCQVENRALELPGIDPCPELATRAGIWRFDALGEGQVQDDGVRVATGTRNANAMAIRPRTGELVVAVNGRDQLAESWPDLFTAEDDARAPSEELLVVREGADYGWPYCYHDPDVGSKVLAPEYGGDGATIGRCADAAPADAIFPAHWAPLGIEFLQGRNVGAYRGGALVTFHGSRFDEDPDGRVPGYNVGFVPFSSDGPATPRLFAFGFAGEGRPLPDAAEFRPVGVAQGPDGTIFVSDDVSGRIWRIFPPIEEAPIP
jgi:glucose/arabinose dehydrogenase